MRCCGLNLGLPAFKAYTQLIRAIRLASGFVFLKVEIVKLEVRMVFWKAKLPGVKLLWLQGKRMKEAEKYYAFFFFSHVLVFTLDTLWPLVDNI